MGLVLGLARSENMDELAAMAGAAFRATYSWYNPAARIDAYLARHQQPQHFRAILADPHQILLEGRLDGETVAYAHLGDNLNPLSHEPAMELKRFYVAAAHHGTGMAGKLMELCSAQTRERGFAQLWLGVWEHNHRAAAFYRKWGFEAVGTIPFYFEEDVQTDLLLVKTLGAQPA